MDMVVGIMVVFGYLMLMLMLIGFKGRGYFGFLFLCGSYYE